MSDNPHDEPVHVSISPRPGRGMWDQFFQLYPGTVSIHSWPETSSASVSQVGSVYTRTAQDVRAANPGLTWADDVEQWVATSPETMHNSVIELRALVPASETEQIPNRLTSALLQQHASQRLALLRFQYTAFPLASQIQALPATVPSGRINRSYWVWSTTPGTNLAQRPTLDPTNAKGALYREIDTASGAVYDSWVLLSSYQAPNPSASVWLAANTPGWASRRAFFEHMGTFGAAATQGWVANIGGMDTQGGSWSPAYSWIAMPSAAPVP